ncbi:MAG: hypothetical protein MR564_07735 [Paraprevotella sp.]|nr:hypothetical protein [Paraprevotella sp.]
MYITIPVHEKIFIKQGQVHPEGLKNTSEIAPFFQYSFNTHSIPFKASPFPHFFLKILAHPNKCLIFAAPEPAKPLNDAQMSGSFFFIYDTSNSFQ